MSHPLVHPHRQWNTASCANIRMFVSHVIVFTTFPADGFSAADVLRWYRVRWQVE